MNDPLTTLTHHISAAREQLFNEPLAPEPRVDDPLARLQARVASGVRAAGFAPPLTGLVADIEAAAHIRDHALVPQDHDLAYDVLVRLSPPTAPPALADAPRSIMLEPSPSKKKQAAPAAREPSRAPAPAVSSGGGIIASVLFDAIATRDLPGAARAEAARQLSEGLALGDEALMREALATLITGA